MKRTNMYNICLITILVLSSLSLFVFDNTFATHISKPILTMDKQTFEINENITVKGWVEYQNNPASDVLLDIVVINEPDGGNELIRSQVMSNDTGNFTANVILPVNTAPGNYTLTVISQCREEHRNICTNQNSSIPIGIVKS
jgi:DNA/RNA endonuclease YhcR with UshA esterase domain